MILYWKRDIVKGSLVGFCGKIRFFSVVWDAFCPPRDDMGNTIPYDLKCFLPGTSGHIGHFKNEEEAKDKAEHVLNTWLKNTNLEVKNA